MSIVKCTWWARTLMRRATKFFKCPMVSPELEVSHVQTVKTCQMPYLELEGVKSSFIDLLLGKAVSTVWCPKRSSRIPFNNFITRDLEIMQHVPKGTERSFKRIINLMFWFREEEYVCPSIKRYLSSLPNFRASYPYTAAINLPLPLSKHNSKYPCHQWINTNSYTREFCDHCYHSSTCGLDNF